jgi:hypothetical protein
LAQNATRLLLKPMGSQEPGFGERLREACLFKKTS